VVDGNKCIQCLCCQELCPQGAFEIKASSWLGTLAMKIMEGLNANRPLD
jgi:Fe-S-cluster-containing hydrogenase component 2